MRPIKSSLRCCCHLWLTNSLTLIQDILTTMKMNDISWGGVGGGGGARAWGAWLVGVLKRVVPTSCDLHTDRLG